MYVSLDDLSLVLGGAFPGDCFSCCGCLIKVVALGDGIVVYCVRLPGDCFHELHFIYDVVCSVSLAIQHPVYQMTFDF